MEEGLFNNKYRIKSTRHEAWDYSRDGYYFVTICTKDRKLFFGKIENGKIILNKVGDLMKEEWLRTVNIRKNVKLDEFVVMPNHFHAIIQILNMNVETHCNASPSWSKVDMLGDKKETHNSAPLQQEFKNKFGSQTNNLSSIIRGFKSATKKTVVEKLNNFYFAWQKRYYDRIIRNDIELNKIRQYIVDNPLRWEVDKNNPKNF
jgi:putative transposase